eukprot:jgi/Psemu1/30104/gm1.30104_g
MVLKKEDYYNIRSPYLRTYYVQHSSTYKGTCKDTCKYYAKKSLEDNFFVCKLFLEGAPLNPFPPFFDSMPGGCAPMFLRLFVLVATLSGPTLLAGSLAEYDGLDGKQPCSLCRDGGDFEYPDAIIPFYALPNADTPTCSDMARMASMVPFDSKRCTKDIQPNAGYCGCGNETEPKRSCTFCPNGDTPERPDLTLEEGETCSDLDRYVSFFDDEQCHSVRFHGIARNAYECGCGISLSHMQKVEVLARQDAGVCKFCPDGSSPPDDDFFLELAGLTCGEYSSFIHSLDATECDVQTSRGTFDLFAFQCDCPDTAPPVCPRQENPELCTVSLLNTVDIGDDEQQCECYSFCDGEFVGCDSYPGNFLGDRCPGTRISGCNYAGAIDDVNGDDTGIDDKGSCKLCPDATNDIRNPDAILPPFSGVSITGSNGGNPTCRDLVDHLTSTQQSEDDGDCAVAQSRLAHLCGCDDAEPSCTLCPGGLPPPYATKMATEDATCEEFAGTVLTWERSNCEIGASYLPVIAARCGCLAATMPVCPVQQYPVLCTSNLLRSTDEDCDCYNFCGNEFHSCADHPGRLLDASDCPGGALPIAGCNRALATSQRCGRGSIGPPCNTAIAPPQPQRQQQRQRQKLRYLRH